MDHIKSLVQKFSPSVQKNLLEWLEKDFNPSMKKEIIHLMETNPEEIKNAFYQKLSFGTAGARGIMGIGTNRLNIYTIRGLAQGVANYLKKMHCITHPSVVISYDNRNNSSLFAQETAQVLAFNHIKVYLCQSLRPVPYLSFAVRQKKATAGIMITASHNPPQYNGFKVYWSDGGQILPPHDQGIIEEVASITDLASIQTADLDNPLIIPIYENFDHVYLEHLSETALIPNDNHKTGPSLKIVYSNLHGSGITLMPQALNSWGFSNIHLVEKQRPLLGSFDFAPKPNPEEKETLQMGIEDLLKTKGDIFLATDPDADRIGAVVLHQNKPVILSGNQVAAILLDHICSFRTLPSNAACIKSIVTTRLMETIAKSYKISCLSVLTGFKYIAQKITEWEHNHNHTFIFGAEESCGYLHHTFVRDKDAISSGCLIAEAALQAKKNNKTLVDHLFALYKKHGIYQQKLLSLSFPEGEEEMKKMQTMIDHLRKNPPQYFGNISVISLSDYQLQTSTNYSTKETQKLSLPPSNVLTFTLDNDSTITIRPSGTEPKIKVYIEVVLHDFSSIEEGIAKADQELEMLDHLVRSHLH
ncbi:MAG: phospho-sugar mutase [Parachlamydiales bacterium]|nr:phospho-sugar mutase [Parachlamydiales bacterium]